MVLALLSMPPQKKQFMIGCGNMMKLVALVIVEVIGFFLMALVAAEINPLQWADDERFFYACVVFPFLAIITLTAPSDLLE